MFKHINKIILIAFAVLSGFQANAKTVDEWVAELGYNRNISYDATQVMKMQNHQMSQKIHYVPKKQMLEMTREGMNVRTIVREDLGKAYTIMPSLGMYQEVDISETMNEVSGGMDLHTVKKVGKETIDGFKATKFKVKLNNPDGQGDGFFWITDEGIQIKSDMIYTSQGEKGQRIEMKLTDIQIRAQDPKLFEVPAGMKNMNMGNLSEMMQGRSPANNQAASNSKTPRRQEPGLIEDVGQAAQDELHKGVVNETRDTVKKGLRGLFGM